MGLSLPSLQGPPSRVESGRLDDLRAASGRPPSSRRDSGPLSPGRSPPGSRGELQLQGLARVESGRPGSALGPGSGGQPDSTQAEATGPAAEGKRIMTSPAAAQTRVHAALVMFICCIAAMFATSLQCQELLLGDCCFVPKVTLD